MLIHSNVSDLMKRKAAQKRLIEIVDYLQVDWGLNPEVALHLLAV